MISPFRGHVRVQNIKGFDTGGKIPVAASILEFAGCWASCKAMNSG
jgi:hypothetical protein